MISFCSPVDDVLKHRKTSAISFRRIGKKLTFYFVCGKLSSVREKYHYATNLANLENSGSQFVSDITRWFFAIDVWNIKFRIVGNEGS